MNEILSAIKLKDKITIAAVMASVALVLAGVVGAITYFTADRHAHVYDYSLQMQDDGSFSVVGVCQVPNCEKPYYNKNNLQGVSLFSAKSPSCSAEGNRVYAYNFNGLVLKYTEILPKSAHSYEYELITRDEVLYINGKCTVDGCENPYIFINNVEDLKLIHVEEGTCFTPRKETYSYVAGGVSGTFITLVDEDIPHTLGGVLVDTVQNDKGEFPYGTAGVTILKPGELKCGESAEGYFVCEVCRQVEVAKVRYPDHDFKYNEAGLVRPTTESQGTALLVCANEGCTKSMTITIPEIILGVNTKVTNPATELHPDVVTYVYNSDRYGFTVEFDCEMGEPLSHSYVYKLEPIRDEDGKIDTGHIDLVGICSQPECQTPEIREQNVATSFEDTSSCQDPGEYIWTYDKDGEILTLKVMRTELGSHRYAYDGKEENVEEPTLTEAGWVKLYCTVRGCNQPALVVELPPIVIGENAEVRYEEGGHILVAYEYVTDYNCTVNLMILIKE